MGNYPGYRAEDKAILKKYPDCENCKTLDGVHVHPEDKNHSTWDARGCEDRMEAFFSKYGEVKEVNAIMS